MMDLFDRLQTLAQSQPHRIALRDTTTALTYHTLWQQIQALADQLQQAGVRRLALQLDNGLDWARIDLACALAGIVLIPMPTFFSPQQQDWLLDSSGADALIGPARTDWQAQTSILAHPLQRHTPAQLPPLPPGTAKITYTSGTTGQPKGVCLSLEQMMRTSAALAERIALAQIGEHLTLLPLSTLLENLTGLYVPLLLGAASRIPRLAEVGFSGSSQLDPEQLAATLLASRPHSLVLVPELLRLLVALCARQPALCESLRFVAVGGGKVAPDLITNARALGLPVFEGYGLSECGSVVALNSPGQDKAGSAGQPLSHLSVRIADDGEVMVAGASMLGYLGETTGPMPEIATGDLGRIDEAGFLHLTGRKKNVQITAFGRNFSPEWVEAEAQLCPAIARLVIFGEGLAQNVALIQPRAGFELELPGQIATLNARLPDYARVHRWFIPATPLSTVSGLLTPNGRPRRDRIFQAYQQQILNIAQGETA